MSFDPKFTRDVLLPVAVHAYTIAGLPRPCESLDDTFHVLGTIDVDPETCRQVWLELANQTRMSDHPVEAARASDMLTAVMADSHIFGFVATKEQETFVSFRGTHFLSEWLDDADLPLVAFRFRSNAGDVHMGFQAVYETIRKSILALLARAGAGPLTIVGHSLGAALATLCALDAGIGRPARVCPIASPRVGDGRFRDLFNQTQPDCVRVVNKPDIVPHVPLPIGYRHVGSAAVVNSGPTLDLVFAHGLCEGYLRGLNRTIATPATLSLSHSGEDRALLEV
jgi:hypothetical protein